MAKLMGSMISGDLGKKNDVEALRFFRRKIRSIGTILHSAKELPVKPFAKAGGDNS